MASRYRNYGSESWSGGNSEREARAVDQGASSVSFSGGGLAPPAEPPSNLGRRGILGRGGQDGHSRIFARGLGIVLVICALCAFALVAVAGARVLQGADSAVQVAGGVFMILGGVFGLFMILGEATGRW